MEKYWETSEANNYFERNKVTIEKLSAHNDRVMMLLDMYNLKPKSVVEIGCSNGYRLSFIHQKYQSKVTGIEPSTHAIRDGKKKYPFIKFHPCTCEKTNIRETFDLAIIHFVLHWIDRHELFTCIKKIDGLIEKGGFLVLGDFGTDSFVRVPYHHDTKKEAFTYKMPYWDLFLRSGNYQEIAKFRFVNDSKKLSANFTNKNMGTIVLMQKKETFIQV